MNVPTLGLISTLITPVRIQRLHKTKTMPLNTSIPAKLLKLAETERDYTVQINKVASALKV